MKRVEEPVHEHAVVREREVTFLLYAVEARDPEGEVGLAVRGDQSADQLVLELGHDRRGEVDLLEERMHGAPDLDSGQLARPVALDRPLAHPEPVAREVLVRTLLEQRQRRERELAHAVQRRLRQGDKRRQLGCRVGDGYLLERGEERQLAFLNGLGLGRDGLTPIAVEANEQPSVAANELDRLVTGPRELRVGIEPVEDPRDRGRYLALRAEVDRAGDDQPLLRARQRDVVET